MRALLSRRPPPTPACPVLRRPTVGRLAPARAGLPGRACPCEGTAGPEHSFERLRVLDPRELEHPGRKDPFAPVTEDEDDEFGGFPGRRQAEDPPHDLPHNGSATIVCDGRGGYRVSMGWAASARCGIRECVRRHEESHITDWQRRWPDGCRNADGSAKRDGTAVPTGGDGYAAFLRRSECTAYRVEIPCETELLASAPEDCRDYIQHILDDSRRQERHFCS